MPCTEPVVDMQSCERGDSDSSISLHRAASGSGFNYVCMIGLAEHMQYHAMHSRQVTLAACTFGCCCVHLQMPCVALYPRMLPLGHIHSGGSMQLLGKGERSHTKQPQVHGCGKWGF